MSRKANKPIAIPEGATVDIADQQLTVKGPKGELSLDVHHFVTITKTDEGVVLSVKDPADKEQGAMWGTFGAHVSNMLQGVTEGFTKQLEINGVGYGFDVSGDKLTIKAGYSHQVDMEIPKGIDVTQDKNVITLTSHDKQLVGQFASQIRKVRKPEPYKGKGIKYVDEIIIRKQGKQAAGAAGA